MSREEILSAVTDIVAAASGLDKAELDPAKDFIDELCLDSLAIIEIIIDLERRFNMEISDELSERMHDINDVVDYIEKHGPDEN